jgi:hypothetical protein
LGAASDVTQKTGLNYEAVTGSLTNAVSKTKMFGTTISSVAPVLSAFGESLKKVGKEGFATELMDKYMSKLGDMSLAQRSFMGMQSGMGKFGAIGGGLRMEAALESKSPEGMKQVMDGLTKTLTNFGGGKIITRQEALDNPQLERSFIVQRSLLEKQMGLNTQEANTMMGVLKDIESGGLSTADISEEKLGELLKAGEKTIQDTTSIQDAATKAQVAATQQAGSNIVEAIGKLADRMGIGGVLKQTSEIEN